MKGIDDNQYECVWLDATSYSLAISTAYKCELTGIQVVWLYSRRVTKRAVP